MFPPFKGTTRYDKIEVNIPNGYTQNFINFPQNLDQLRTNENYDIAVQAIEMFTKFDQALSSSGQVMPTVAQMVATMLILYVDGEQSNFNIPLTQLHRCIAVDGSGATVPYVRELPRFDNLSVSWAKTQLFNPAANGWNTGGSGVFSFEFGIHYLRLPPGTLSKLGKIQNANYTNLPKM
jgi:hypothetical protein